MWSGWPKQCPKICRTFGQPANTQPFTIFRDDHNTTEEQVLSQYRDYFRKLRLGIADIARLEAYIKGELHLHKPLPLIKQEVEVKLRFLGQNVRI